MSKALITKLNPKCRTFKLSGIDVEEMIFECWDVPGISKIIWSREPFDQMVVNGLPNPLFHVNYGDGQDCKYLNEARTAVENTFKDYYHLEK